MDETALSFAQQRLWILDQLQPGTSVYNVRSGWQLEGPLDRDVLERSLGALVERHEGLRTTFCSVNGVARQVIHSQLLTPLALVDLRPLPRAARSREARRLVAEEVARPFDLERGPLIRAVLVRLEDELHQLSLTMHHIVSDEGTIEVLMKELASVYGAFLRGQPSPLAPLPIQYADYAVWQREWLQGEVLESQLRYWKQQLSGAAPTLELPTDRPRPAAQTHRGAQQRLILPRSLAEGLQGLCRSERATSFMVLLAGFQALLHRYSGQQDICVGTPMGGRNRVELEAVVGFFVNTLVMRTDCSGRPTFRQLLTRVRETALGAYSHQDVPFDKLVEVLKPERSLGRNPLFQVMFSFEDLAERTLELPGLSVTPVQLEASHELFDLTFSVRQKQGSFSGELTYSTDLFAGETIERMGAHLVRLLEDAVAHPDKPIGELELLTQGERANLLAGWNASATGYLTDKFIHQLFEDQARRSPDAVAVEFEGQSLTYAQLDRQANHLAHRLVALGVGPEVRVALCLERSLELPVGLLGVLKAGGAYVPLDPAYPGDRLAYILSDARAQVCVTQQRLAAALPVTARTLCIDADPTAEDRALDSSPRARLEPANAAYLIYTSGSTGLPKGVVVTHGSIANHARQATAAFGLGPADRVLQFASVSFDVAAEEIYPTWHAGATLVLSPLLAHDIDLLAREGRLTVLNLPSALWHQWVEQLVAGAKVPPSVRLVVIGSEAARTDQLNLWHRHVDARVRLLNAYGPTEATVTTAVYQTARGTNLETPFVPIGRSFAGARLCVLDANLGLVPAGVPGELYIGGPSVARGYLNRPELTADRFVPDPFGVEGARLYRTGDRVKHLADGNLEYLGRADFQVKIRGFRVELGEVEAVLLAQPSVRCGVVVAREDLPGDVRLVAYVVGVELSADELRSGLKKSLPEYMVPAAFVTLAALPRMPSGKVDRKALPAPVWGGDSTAYLAPTTPIEEALSSIWAGVLSLERVGVGDDFFALGGHSLMATRVAAQARKLGFAMTPQMLFQFPTIAQLAQALSGAPRPLDEYPHWRALPPISPGPRDAGEVPLSYPEQRLLTVYLHRQPPTFNVEWDGVYLDGPLDLRALSASFEELFRRHDVLRSRYWQRDGQLGKTIEAPGSPPLEVIDLRGEPEASRVARAFTHAFELIHGPRHPLVDSSALRLCIYRLADERHLLSFIVGHLIYDFNSFLAVWEALKELYPHFARGEVPPESTALQYTDFARWQRKCLTGVVLDEGRAFWKKYLGDAKPLLRMLPTDLPREPVDEDRARDYLTPTVSVCVKIEIPAAAVARLVSIAARHRASRLAVAYGAFAAVMAKESSQPDVVISNVNDIRGRVPGLEGMIGLLTNNSPLRIDVPPGLTFDELVARAREAVLAVYTLPEFQIIPHFYPTLNDMLRVVFNFRPEGEPLTWPDCSTSRATVPAGFALPRNPGFLDLVVQVDALASGDWVAMFCCNSRLRTKATIQRYADRYRTLLENAAADPSLRLDQLWGPVG